MTHADLTQAVTELTVYLGAKMPPDAAVKAWLAKVERIPSEAVPYIVQRITDDADRMPANLPKQFRALYGEWQAEHTTSTTPIQQTGCGECIEGILWLEKPGTGETAVIYCTCYRGNPGAIGRASLATMQRQGWQKIDFSRYAPPTWHGQISGQMQQARMDYCHPDHRRIDFYDDQPFS